MSRCQFLQFSTLAIACLLAYVTSAFLTACLYIYAFIISARLFLERVIHAFIRSKTFPTAFLYAYYFGSLVFRTSHTCIYSFSRLFQPRSYMRIISARLFLQQAIHAFIRSQDFSNRVLILTREICAKPRGLV